MAQIDEKTYDVALSFAGEDRPYVSQVAEYVKNRGLKVFYDSFFDVELWGKDLTETLDSIYRNETRFVIMFVSSSYLKKEWTNFERKSALAAALKYRNEYVLPVRFDDTDLPGLAPVIGYKDARVISADALAEMIIAKVGKPAKAYQRDGITAWRFARSNLIDNLTGREARAIGGRWNSPGVSIIYCSSSYCAAFMEMLVRQVYMIPGIAAMQLLIPPEVSIRTVYENSLPAAWRNMDEKSRAATQDIGSQWVDAMESCILSVPSARVPYERILLLNPLHPEFGHIRVGPSEPVHVEGPPFGA